MKILAIRLRNLNSLTGSWAIDFTAPELAATGIFAITGPTGAGKSTILDAICLALFARTPRLGHISKGSNEIMARRTGDCFAEVDFATSQGCFRCHWGQHRARRSPGGDLQPPRHEIADIRTGQVLETRSKEIGRLVEQVTGMDYDRFTRSILLAQGDFAAFLEADADQRAPLLEQITGTGVYSRISMAVHERTGAERHTTAALRETVGKIALLGEDEEQALTAAITEGETTAAALNERLNRLGQTLHRLEAIAALHTQMAETDGLLADLAQRRNAAEDDLSRLDRGQRAQSLLAEHSQWRQSEERLATLRAREAALAASLDQLRRERQEIAESHDQAVQAVAEAAAHQQREAETIVAVRALDLLLHEKHQLIAHSQAALRRSEQERDEGLRQRRGLEQPLAEIASQQEHLAVYFRDHDRDGLLVEQLAGFRQQLQQISARETALPALMRTLAARSAAQDKARQQAARLEQEAQQAAEELTALHQRRQDLLTRQEALLAGQELSAWRRQVEEETERWRQLEQAAGLLARQQETQAELAALALAHQDLLAQEQRCADELRIIEEQRQVREQLLRQCELNQRLRARITSFEEERKQLRPGDPCPLCGATSHPWGEHQPALDGLEEDPVSHARSGLDEANAAMAKGRETRAGLAKDIEHGNLARAKGQRQLDEWTRLLAPLLTLFGDANEVARQQAQGAGRVAELRRRVQEADCLEDELRAVHSRQEQALVRHHDLQRQAQAARHDAAACDGEVQRLEGQIRDEQSWLASCRDDLARQVQPLGIETCPPGQAGHLLCRLEARLLAWKERLAQAAQLQERHNRLQTECGRIDQLLAGIAASLAQQAARLAELEGKSQGLREQRRARYGDRDPNVEEQRLRAEVQRAETQERTIRARLVEADKQTHGQEEQARLNGEELAALAPAAQAQAAHLLGLLPSAGFAGLDDFQAALLPAATLTALDALKQGLDREQAALIARRAEQAAALIREEEQRQDRRGREEVLAEQEELNREAAAVQQRIGADRERLRTNERNRSECAAQQQALAAQQREQERWELLHLLIGSADGKKFRVFAQGLTFEIMISHANRQLRRMSDRYLLLRDPKEPLALQVIDSYQAGEIRSTRNLSGGESFLVSLALALGLSAMASHTVRVDSLFLDEGFGTLDEDSLDAALQVLGELRQDGKLIGIISHVPLLRDRIDVRIQVQPGPGGTSRLLGPGCARLA